LIYRYSGSPAGIASKINLLNMIREQMLYNPQGRVVQIWFVGLPCRSTERKYPRKDSYSTTSSRRCGAMPSLSNTVQLTANVERLVRKLKLVHEIWR
jgi:hypothetical protein